MIDPKFVFYVLFSHSVQVKTTCKVVIRRLQKKRLGGSETFPAPGGNYEVCQGVILQPSKLLILIWFIICLYIRQCSPNGH